MTERREADPGGRRTSGASPGAEEKTKTEGRRIGAAYQGSLEAVLAIVIGVGVGYAVDRHFGTEPWGIMVGLGFGFGAFVLRVVRLGREFQSQQRGAGEGRDDPGGES